MAKHKTTHAAHVDNHGMIMVWCEFCDWRQKVRVADLSFEDGLKAIFAVRDAHEAEKALNASSSTAPSAAE